MFASIEILAVLVVTLVVRVPVSNGIPIERIIANDTAALGEFPYQVSIRFGGQHYCGGTIIDSRHILTAAHCNPEQFFNHVTVATGTIHSNAGELHAVKNFSSHPDYDPYNLHVHDIAIITLADRIRFNKNQNKIDIPTTLIEDNVYAVVSGWGYTNGLTETSLDLMKLNIKMIPRDMCRKRHDIQESQLCGLTRVSSGACESNSGNPIVESGKVIGIVSMRIPCTVGMPHVYTSTYHHRNWIHKNMGIW